MTDYMDPKIRCTDQGIEIRDYYFPGIAKRIPWGALKGVRKAQVSALRGRARIWGTANFRYWANLDPKRPRKSTAFLLDIGRAVQPFVTPDDPGAFESAMKSHAPSVHVVDAGDAPFV